MGLWSRALGLLKLSASDGASREDGHDPVQHSSRADRQMTAETFQRCLEIAPLVSQVLFDVGAALTPGMTTREVNDAVHRRLVEQGLVPAMLGYNGFPATCAVSINDECLHGLPSGRQIASGDVVKIQLAGSKGTAHAAQGWTFLVGEASEADSRMDEVGRQALEDAVDAAVAGARTGDIGAAIQATVERDGYSVIRDFVGCGIGPTLCMDPQIPCFGKAGRGVRLRKDMFLHLQVLLKAGSREIIIADDEWTARSADGQRGALYTAMVRVDEVESEELTIMT